MHGGVQPLPASLGYRKQHLKPENEETMKIWTTDLETWRFWRKTGNFDLLERLTETPDPTEAMLAGSALHKAAESAPVDIDGNLHPLEHCTVTHEGKRYTFSPDPELNLIPGPVREYRFETQIGDTIISGKIDWFEPDGTLVDLKTRIGRNPFPRFWWDSWQWRVYLAATGEHAFRYTGVRLDRYRTRCYRVSARQDLTLYSYPALALEVGEAIRCFRADLARLDPAGTWQGRPLGHTLAA